MVIEQIKEIINKSFKSEFDWSPGELLITNPEPQFGDFAVACHAFAKELKQSPQDIASKLSDAIDDEVITKTDAVAGYLNITIDVKILAKEVLSDINQNYKFQGSTLKREKVLLEYSSPNTNKPLHLGHIRNNVLGMSLANLLKAQGADVTKVQLVNDRGIHIMKSLVAYQKLGKGKTPAEAREKGDHFVGSFYVKFNEDEMMDDAQEALRKWEKGDKEIKDLWEKMNAWVYKGYEETYKAGLGI